MENKNKQFLLSEFISLLFQTGILNGDILTQGGKNWFLWGKKKS